MDTAVLSALAEPNRLNIVELLREGPLTVGRITDRLELRQPQVSQHLRVLLDAGIVDMQAAANRRIYRLRLEPFKELDDWLDSYRQMWNERYDRLDAHLQDLMQQNNEHEDKG
ncbi:ArsR/SmtB family transcription factor [Paenibacillus xerothermodurans]|uniref:ArsR family transcriptional regulator n=1 Tax=Paenibacillus xerothermodurans TaxID=1977292 RepID=A0A2W1N2U4_PAEXE|nr:metalloregulator ArsR/SmtB family transcription factor [Paenibacillus xerothermodurans]PZE19009.1 ArsR family transcriptional regulator [Paenibacillus xerothermodurans]